MNFDRLRYRMLPYIYSLAWKTTSESYTPMRPLVMDFRTDVRAQNIGDQFMFGPAILVNPVTEPAATTRRLYLPESKWYDFWTGSTIAGGRTLDGDAPLERLPLYVRAGSILPLGPDQEWTTQKPADPIELRIYRGADADFTLYEDENDGYNYEKGAYATIPLHWDDTKQALTIGDRKGQFPGMLPSRTFRVVFVGESHGIGVNPEDKPDKIVQYSGKSVAVALAGCGKTRFEADAVPRNSLVSTARPDKKKACAEKTSNSWTCSATSAPSSEFRTITPCALFVS